MAFVHSSISESQKAELNTFAERLRHVDEEPRKLLAQITELANSSGNPEREKDTAYVPEILESCGLDVDHMYELLRALKNAHLISLEDQYPFEKVKLESPEALKYLQDSANQRNVSLRELLVKADFTSP